MPIRERRTAGAQAAAFIAKWCCCCRPFLLIVERMQLHRDMCRKKWLTFSVWAKEKGGRPTPKYDVCRVILSAQHTQEGRTSASKLGKVQVVHACSSNAHSSS